ncbi:MBL fold metallo-hydrolase [Pseudobacteroides cellulosolvens]|uniref:Beta-lactamase domain protein n=1 Tax=Pseudobacteroides cellulosolvens ATCC 35603 = DSM 2933 TaxID=398512 RepID=A0A0L6JQ43_9FIRM|nr:MBL fold metallo-hydrolase [Pseudobacteroides cellulosolvens]KNY27961.1 beta-lactamase domain protein [Pseudobacteroides cellulosolvens ATCC 35603 = DSM 2933]
MNQEIISINLGAVNCYLAKQGNSFILFDTGGYITFDKEINNRLEMLEKELDKAGCNSQNLRLIVLTHGDYDHSANAAYIKEKYKTKIAMHKGDLNLVQKPILEDVMKSFCFRSLFLKVLFRIMKKKLERINIKILGNFRGFKPDILLNDGDTLNQYGLDAKIIHIPGHTPGSIAILTENGQLIAGDTFTNTKRPKVAPNALDFHAMDKSIELLCKLDIKTIYPGHGNPFKMNEYK